MAQSIWFRQIWYFIGVRYTAVFMRHCPDAADWLPSTIEASVAVLCGQLPFHPSDFTIRDLLLAQCVPRRPRSVPAGKPLAAERSTKRMHVLGIGGPGWLHGCLCNLVSFLATIGEFSSFFFGRLSIYPPIIWASLWSQVRSKSKSERILL